MAEQTWTTKIFGYIARLVFVAFAMLIVTPLFYPAARPWRPIDKYWYALPVMIFILLTWFVILRPIFQRHRTGETKVAQANRTGRRRSFGDNRP